MASRRVQILLAVSHLMRVLPMRLATVSTQVPFQVRRFALYVRLDMSNQRWPHLNWCRAARFFPCPKLTQMNWASHQQAARSANFKVRQFASPRLIRCTFFIPPPPPPPQGMIKVQRSSGNGKQLTKITSVAMTNQTEQMRCRFTVFLMRMLNWTELNCIEKGKRKKTRKTQALLTSFISYYLFYGLAMYWLLFFCIILMNYHSSN